MYQEYDLVTPLLLRKQFDFHMFSYEETSIGFIHSICLTLFLENYSTRDISHKCILSIAWQSFYPKSLPPFLNQGKLKEV